MEKHRGHVGSGWWQVSVLPAGPGTWPSSATSQEHRHGLGASKGLGWEVMAVMDPCGRCSCWAGGQRATFALRG